MTFFLLLIAAAGSVNIDARLEPADFWAALCDADSTAVPSGRGKSLLAVLAPMFEPELWPVYLSHNGEPADANIIAPEQPQNGNDKNHISALAVHALCADILGTYVNERGLVDYKTLKRKRLVLLAVLNEFADLDPNSYAAWSEADKLAFWINAHNMCMLRAVIDNYPIQPSRFRVIFYPPDSIMQIGDFWEKADYQVMRENYSLNEIENKILRGQFHEPRVCFAISYASLGCAPLRREPYYGRNLSEQLDDQARIFLESDRGMQIDRDARVVSLSAIFQWYGKEFLARYTPAAPFADKDPMDGAVLTYIGRQIPRKDADWLLRKIFTVRYMKYDWTLNEQF